MIPSGNSVSTSTTLSATNLSYGEEDLEEGADQTAEFELMNQLDTAFPMRRKNQKTAASSRAEKIRREHALSREIRQKMRAAETSFRDLSRCSAHFEVEQAVVTSSSGEFHCPFDNGSSQEIDKSSSHSASGRITRPKAKKNKSFRRMMKKSLSWKA